MSRAPLVLTPVAAAAPAATAAAAPMSLIGDGWEDDPSMNLSPVTDPGTPMGLNLEPSEQPTLEAKPGPGAEVPKLLVMLGAGWVLWAVLTLSAMSGRRLNAIRWPRPAWLRWPRRRTSALEPAGDEAG